MFFIDFLFLFASSLSGFLKISESEYDAFGAGHASTSISAAAGIAEAQKINGKNHRVVSVIGDGSMTGGLAFEAMNKNPSCQLIVAVLEDQVVVMAQINFLVNLTDQGGIRAQNERPEAYHFYENLLC